ncbi:MAG: sensor histidine kinase [Betaproteobacteria bacterium]
MRWYRSFYWRIAIGLVAAFALTLALQAVVFIWAVARSGRTLPGESPARFARTVAVDLSAAIEQNPQLDVARYVHEQYAQVAHPFFVLLADGRMVTSGSTDFPEPLVRMARERMRRQAERMDRFPRFERPDSPAAGGRPGFVFSRPAPVVVDGKLAALVVVPPRAPFRFLFWRLGPTLALVAAGVLVLGTIGAAVVIFGPARRRLRELETAARRFGAGDLSARAPDRGGDEIAAVASAFNTMADQVTGADRARRQLLADVSHELNTPVTAMRGYIETLTMPELPIDEAARARYLGIIGDETARLERLIGDLLDLARLEGGGGEWRSGPVPIAPLFARVAARHERASAQAGVRIETDVASGAETVVGDGDRLEQALQNLAANALRYAPAGTAVRLSARPEADAVTMVVEDEGPGIPPERLPYIFDRFYKAETSRDGTTGGGSGLGLSIAKAIVERHGGRIAATSRPGRTTVSITGLRRG